MCEISLTDYAKMELSYLSKLDASYKLITDDLQILIDIIYRLNTESKLSASKILYIINRLLDRRPLTELQDTDDEWEVCCEYADAVEYINKRFDRISRKKYDNGDVKTVYSHRRIISTSTDDVCDVDDYDERISFPYEVPNKEEINLEKYDVKITLL